MARIPQLSDRARRGKREREEDKREREAIHSPDREGMAEQQNRTDKAWTEKHTPRNRRRGQTTRQGQAH